MDIKDSSAAFQQGYKNRLKNKLFGLLNEFEKDREWEAFLDAIILEIMGIPEEDRTIDYYTLSHNLNTLRYIKHKYFRKTIFSCMTIIQRMKVE